MNSTCTLAGYSLTLYSDETVNAKTMLHTILLCLDRKRVLTEYLKPQTTCYIYTKDRAQTCGENGGPLQSKTSLTRWFVFYLNNTLHFIILAVVYLIYRPDYYQPSQARETIEVVLFELNIYLFNTLLKLVLAIANGTAYVYF